MTDQTLKDIEREAVAARNQKAWCRSYMPWSVSVELLEEVKRLRTLVKQIQQITLGGCDD